MMRESSFDQEDPRFPSSPQASTGAMVGRFLGATSALAAFLLVVTSGFDNKSVAVGVDTVAAAVVDVISPLCFGTMTMYWDQRNTSLDLAAMNTSADDVQASDLELLQLQQVSRHGSRFPTDNTMEEIADLLQRLQTEYQNVLPLWLQEYSLPYNLSVAGALSATGFNELAAYGKRTRESVGSAFPKTYNASLFKLAHTFKTRTGDSATAFASTFFDNPTDVQYIEYAKGKDRFLRFYDVCDRYQFEVKRNPSASAELKAYGNSSQMNESTTYLKTRLNLPTNASLSVTDVRAAFAACAFDVMVYGVTNQWCSLMDQTFLDRLDYAEDLESFYEQGPGFQINYEMAAVLLQDVYAYMKNFTTGDTNIVGNLRFGHAETTIPLMILLGYGDRTKLLASWSDEQIESRGFRTSILSPTASNIDFRLHKSKKDGKFYVSVWIQEVVAPLPGCDAVYCELSKVEQLWSYYLNEYNFKRDCKKKK